MKYLFLVIALFIGPVCMAHSDENFIKSDLFGNLGERDKAAILIIHFGTTHDDTRVLTIDAINAKMKEAFPGIEVREAWTAYFNTIYEYNRRYRDERIASRSGRAFAEF